jgi:hypothetical protein
MRFNPTVYNQLPSASKGGKVEAILLEYDFNGNQPKPLWTFLVNPQSLKIKNQANYTEIKPLAATGSEIQYQSTDGQTLSISDMDLRTWYYGKSLRPLLEGLNKLLESDIKNQKYSPPILKFKMGSREFGPCVLTQIQWDETAWLGGEPASVKLGLELRQVTKATSRGEIEKRQTKLVSDLKKDREKRKLPRIPLTDRQRKDASSSAKKYLETNISIFTPDIQTAIRGNQYALSTDKDTGKVKMIGKGGKELGVVLVWDGRSGKAGQGVTTLPTAKDKKLPELK